MMRAIIGAVVAALLLGSGIAAGQAATPAVKVGVLTDGASDRWTAFRDAAAKEAATGVDLDFRVLSPATPEQQQKTAAEMLAAGDTALALCPLDPAQEAAFLKETAAKVPLVLLNRDAPDSGRACFIGMDDKETGTKMAELVGMLVPYGMRIGAMVKSGDSPGDKARLEGLREGLAPKEFVLNSVMADKGDRNLAWANADEMMTKHFEYAAVVAFEPYEMPGLLRAASAHKMAGIVNLIGFLDSPDMQEAFEEGRIQGRIRPDTETEAKKAVEALRGLAAKDPAFKLPENGVIHVPALIDRTPKPMTPQEKTDALQIPRVPQDAPTAAPAPAPTPAPAAVPAPTAPARPSFE